MKKWGLAILLVAGAAFAQEHSSGKTIYVRASGTDTVGKALVFKVREGIRRSADMKLVDNELKANLVLNIVTLDVDKNRPGNSSAYSLVWLVRARLPGSEYVGSMFHGQVIGTCGSVRVDECATGVVAEADGLFAEMSDPSSAIRTGSQR